MSPNFFHRSLGNRLSWSMASARGAISLAAKPLICSRSMSRVSPRPKLNSEYCDFMVGYLLILLLFLLGGLRLFGGGLCLFTLSLLQVSKRLAASCFCGVHFHFCLGNVVFLLLQLRPFAGQGVQHQQELFFVAAEGFVPQVKKLLGFRQGKAHAFAPEDQLQPHPVLRAEDPGLAAPGGVQ
mmetsp:Transcript_6101/g.9590  ORF Transcript_6101/g.9590 Transcript_6101/m.9590 type:complete len:182 (-) Transcript_6101:100-645(-)